MLELKLFVNVPAMLNRPVIRNILVDAGAICPELGSWLHLLEQEACSVLALGMGLVNELPGQFTGPYLLGTNEAPVGKEGFVHLYNLLKHVVLLRQVPPELVKPVVHRNLAQAGKVMRLLNWYLFSPAPQEHPPLYEWQFHV